APRAPTSPAPCPLASTSCNSNAPRPVTAQVLIVRTFIPGCRRPLADLDEARPGHDEAIAPHLTTRLTASVPLHCGLDGKPGIADCVSTTNQERALSMRS